MALDIYKTLRPPVRDFAKSVGMKRVSSKPPAYTRPVGDRHLSLWVQQSSGGFNFMLGGQFTVNLQLAVTPSIGTHGSASGGLITHRVPTTWSDETVDRVLALHNRIIKKRRRPPPGRPHFLEKVLTPEKIEARYYAPLTELPPDYWMPFLDADDGAAWGVLLAETLDESIAHFLAAIGEGDRDWRG